MLLAVMFDSLIQCMNEGVAPDMDVYDAAAWSAPGPLSFLCVAHDIALPFPDFTRGEWKKETDVAAEAEAEVEAAARL